MLYNICRNNSSNTCSNNICKCICGNGFSVAVDCKRDSRQGKAISFYKFPRNENLTQQWLLKIKCSNIQSMQHFRICHLHFEADCFKRDFQVRKYSLKFWSICVFTNNPRCSNGKLFKKCAIFSIYCWIFQEQLSIKTPLGDCFWVFFISFCKCHGKHFIFEILFSLWFIYLYSEWTVEPSTTKTTESRRYSNYIFLLQKLPTNFMQAKNVRSFRGRSRWAINVFFVIGSFLESCNQNPFKHLRWSFLQKTVNGFKLLTIFGETLHPRCLTGFWIHLCVSCWLTVDLNSWVDCRYMRALLKMNYFNDFFKDLSKFGINFSMIFQNTCQWLLLLIKLNINNKRAQQAKNVPVQSRQKKHWNNV